MAVKTALYGMVLLGQLAVTGYQSTVAQTDNSPHWTSIGARTCRWGCAVSSDLLCPVAKTTTAGGRIVLCQRGPGCRHPERLHYGDRLYVAGIGTRWVTDVMNPRLRRAVDIWVPDKAAEHRVGMNKRRVWVLR